MREKIRVLFLAADPFRDGAQLELEQEMRAIRRALQRGSAHDTLELESNFATRTGDLQLALLTYRPHIVHFSGHGGKDGVIYLSGAEGNPAAVGKAALARLFSLLDSGVRVVVLNACHTHSVVEALRDMVDFAIGTNRAISDVAAIDFSRAFYTALASGAGVQQAFDLGVNQLELDGSYDADVPVLLKQFGADHRPLLATSATSDESALKTRQHLESDKITGTDVEMVGHDHNGAGRPAGGEVDQRVSGKEINGGAIRMIGVRTTR
ncbi:CHAT domain-containing protein [Longimicrobium terrae]|uniref:CHAT domain-containing protein n=1 Tax=Longimicrobium terrae TaxID=1639882 RepID=A0A841GZG0_9BACT|nr:CHAT domain-containing protein [Longimicrobium terrae]MBB4636887.1 hypothetical protein [Longimicrobium terrae]MBB6071114.1 hypothetical protein [Longimicrobium terrae]NNC29163.1 CHAT domain-containing protein [Longimicrobium terrae]